MSDVALKNEILNFSSKTRKKWPKCLIFKEFLAYENEKGGAPGRASERGRACPLSPLSLLSIFLYNLLIYKEKIMRKR